MYIYTTLLIIVIGVDACRRRRGRPSSGSRHLEHNNPEKTNTVVHLKVDVSSSHGQRSQQQSG